MTNEFDHNNLQLIQEVPVIEGRQLKVEQWYAFQLYCQTRTAKELLKKLKAVGFDVPMPTLVRWQGSDWWKELLAFHINFLQENFYIKIFQDLNYLHDALVNIWKGDWEDPATAQAIVTSFRDITKLGKGKVEPLAQLRRDYDVSITKNETINYNTIVNILPHLSEEETNHFGRTGEIPRHIIDQKLLELKKDE